MKNRKEDKFLNEKIRELIINSTCETIINYFNKYQINSLNTINSSINSNFLGNYLLKIDNINDNIIFDSNAFNIVIIANFSDYILDSIISLFEDKNIIYISSKYLRIYEKNGEIDILTKKYESLSKKHEFPEDFSSIPRKFKEDEVFVIQILIKYHDINTLREIIGHTINKCIKILKDIENIRKKIDNIISHFTKYITSSDSTVNKTYQEYKEYIDLISWLNPKNFILLGYCESSILKNDDISINSFGIELENSDINQIEKITRLAAIKNISSGKLKSNLFKNKETEAICIQYPDDINKSSITIIGIFTENSYNYILQDIPIINNKINKILLLESSTDKEFFSEKINNILQYHPRRELFTIDYDDLLKIVENLLIIGKISSIFLYENKNTKITGIFIFVPKNEFNSDIEIKVENFLSNKQNIKYSAKYINFINNSLIRLLFIIDQRDDINFLSDDIVTDLKEEIKSTLDFWGENFIQEFKAKNNIFNINSYKDYNKIFTKSYIQNFTVNEAIYDIEVAENSLEKEIIQYKFKVNNKNNNKFALRIYSPNKQIDLSDIFLSVSNFELKIISIDYYIIKIPNINENNNSQSFKNVYLYHVLLKVKKIDKLIFNDFIRNICSNLEVTMAAIHYKILDNDHFNSLIMYANLNWREVNIMRAIASYIKKSTNHLNSNINSTSEILLEYCDITRDIMDYFYIKFNPINEISNDERLLEIINNINAKISVIENKIAKIELNKYVDLIQSICRTNYMKLDQYGYYPLHISFKIDTKKLKWITNIESNINYEIFVFSKEFEGIHIRLGKTSKGEIILINNNNDLYINNLRNKVIELSQQQIINNSDIVPTGAGAGIIIKNINNDNSIQNNLSHYKEFINAMIDINDIIINNKIIKPTDVVCYDQDDPDLYLDAKNLIISNDTHQISYKLNKYKIIAQGAWILLKNHLYNMNTWPINAMSEELPITIIGIGNMSNKTFAYGMILQKEIKLIAAFDDKYIFLDPNPNINQSFIERQRLATLNSSEWIDYNKSIISKGGGVYLRNSDEIIITEEVQKILNIPEKILNNNRKLTPNNLIKCILQASVDVLWISNNNLYVKASFENIEKYKLNFDNDNKIDKNTLVNASDISSNIIIEASEKPGFITYYGSIEYAKSRNINRSNTIGSINMHHIDSSAGPNCIDYENNIEILLSILIENREINEEEKIEIFNDIKENIAENILFNSYLQGQIINIDYNHNIKHIEYLKDDIDKKIFEKLTLNDNFNKNSSINRYTRPEISILIAYAKNSIKKILGNIDNMVDNSFYRREMLMRYFTKRLNSKYSAYIKNHPLANNIIAIMLTNDFVNTMGSTFFHRLMKEECDSPDLIISSFIISKYGTKINICWNAVQNIFGKIDQQECILLFKEMQDIIMKSMILLLRDQIELISNETLDKTIHMINLYVDSILENLSVNKNLDNNLINSNIYKIIDKNAIKILSFLKEIGKIFSINKIANITKLDINIVIKKYFLIRKELNIDIGIKIFEKFSNSPKCDLGTKTIIDNAIYELETEIEKVCINQLTNYNQNNNYYYSENSNTKSLFSDCLFTVEDYEFCEETRSIILYNIALLKKQIKRLVNN
ncbi:NAD-glutamate dehydrogenase domain-containing protein [Lyticum sinuosum]|uniref:NAD-specific glutamate dehydrogenase n=1 Tax=Lyticum sinuosum TaxID=1332059 RepID=A0AAE4VLY4_9RICK|nr:NAD-glutamate dehydrogenase domain-containing protein [Lyticum sinuosum]MDZ5761113.1 NAD-specific glutamate dehydrogenase [Lyticum sinuosum]